MNYAHPATNPDGTCNDQSCPCQQWSKQPAATASDTVSDCEPGKIDPYEYLKTFKYPPDTEKALRNTRSIIHHAEMVEEQKRTQTTFEQHWQGAPKSIKHGCEMSSAEFFYHAGRRDRETEMLREVNTVLSGVAQRIGQERLR